AHRDGGAAWPPACADVATAQGGWGAVATFISTLERRIRSESRCLESPLGLVGAALQPVVYASGDLFPSRLAYHPVGVTGELPIRRLRVFLRHLSPDAGGGDAVFRAGDDQERAGDRARVDGRAGVGVERPEADLAGGAAGLVDEALVNHALRGGGHA